MIKFIIEGSVFIAILAFCYSSVPDVKAENNKPVIAWTEVAAADSWDTPALIAPEPSRRLLGLFKVVGYYVGGNGLLTATDTICKAGRTVAVDPDVIPYGTHIFIEDIGERIAEDCGGFRGMVVDVYWKTKAECYNWNKTPLNPYRKVWIIEK